VTVIPAGCGMRRLLHNYLPVRTHHWHVRCTPEIS
jgi:hypothetical protein